MPISVLGKGTEGTTLANPEISVAQHNRNSQQFNVMFRGPPCTWRFWDPGTFHVVAPRSLQGKRAWSAV